jgi:ankyrin repeat protein
MPGFFLSRSKIASFCGNATDYPQLEETLAKLAEANTSEGSMPLSELINKKDPNGQRPLTIACYAGQKKTIQLLLKYGAKPEPEDCKATDNESIREILIEKLNEGKLEVTEMKKIASPSLRQ